MSFTNAFNATMGYEGGYAFDPVDPGGETYKGISRVHNPSWEGWAIIDSYKPLNNGYSVLYNSKSLDHLTRQLYEEKYWINPGFDNVDLIFPELAEKLFDVGVNVGTGRVSKWLQSSLNLLNRNGQKYRDITVDGGIGPKTIHTLGECMDCNPGKRIMTVLTVHQGEHYKNIMENKPSQQKYVGWFDRLEF
jgi:lysozyme family protein